MARSIGPSHMSRSSTSHPPIFTRPWSGAQLAPPLFVTSEPGTVRYHIPRALVACFGDFRYIDFRCLFAGGTPNVSDTARAIPNALFSPAWSEHVVGPRAQADDGSAEVVPQMPPEVYAKLSDRGREICRDLLKMPNTKL